MQLKRSPDYRWQYMVEDGEMPHPVSVYGGSDLGVAYLGDIQTTITARCVVWPDKLTYFRVYGDPTLKAILHRAGYKQDAPSGAKVRHIPHRGRIIMPYVDGISHCSRHSTEDWMVLGGGSTSCQQTTGYTTEVSEDYDDEADEDDDTFVCEQCNTRAPDRKSTRLNSSHER